MYEVISILAGVLLSGAASICIGVVLFRRLGIELERTEYLCLAFVVGAACFSETIFALASVHLARKGAFIAIALLAGVVTAVMRRKGPPGIRFAPLPRKWKWFALTLFAAFSVVYLVNALAPEMSPDGAAYHLPNVARYLRAHGFERIAGNFYASLPQGIDLLFLPAVSVGGISSAALLHFLFLLDLPLLMVCYGRRFGFPIPAVAAAFLVFASPVIGWDGTSAYVDVATATILFALFYLTQLWDIMRGRRYLLLIGIVAGFSYAAKYTGVVAVLYAIGVISWKLWRGNKQILRPVLTVSLVSAVFILPWMLKDAILTGNPIAPFANHLFPNPYVHVSFERGYETYLRHYHLRSLLSAPWQLAVKGERLQGFFGPVFLLAPLALLSVRRRRGGQILLAAAAFALPWLLNIGCRFLIPALPLIALALAIALQRVAWALPAIMVLHGLLSWYASPLQYFDRYAPRISELPLRAALRVETQDAYLAHREPGYLIDRMIEQEVPPGGRVFSFEPIPESWTTRDLVIAQNSAENEILADVLRTALVSDTRPARALDLRFHPTLLWGVRATQTARIDGKMWSVSEFQLFEGGRPLTANGNWRMRGKPNPWDVPLAFDRSLVTRWRSWEDATPGMFLEVVFGESELVDRVRLISCPDGLRDRVQIDAMDTTGKWHALAAPPAVTPAYSTHGLRQQAACQLVAHGIRYLLVTPGAFGADDFTERSAEWGANLIGKSERAYLYYLEPNRATPENAAPTPILPDTPVAPGTYDDADPRIHLVRPWTRDPQFQDAYQHTLTYSDLPGAAASLTFTGDAITYVYTGASNRGIAEIWIDGRLRGRLDLYSRETAWKCRQRFDGLGAGRHELKICVTGEQNSQATGSFVDVDAFIVE